MLLYIRKRQPRHMEKQKVVALSSAEAEFRGMAKGLCELLWLRRLLTNIGFTPSFEMNLFCDNKAAIDISHLVQHDRTKHNEVDRHSIKQNLDEKNYSVPICQIRRPVGRYTHKDSVHKELLRLTWQVGHKRYICTNLRGSVGVSC